ncbi:MAG: M48 family metallopeptidase [Defluviitaleaceae bacterium]|nr:M48 family metallopeptidase [Defluviitaleaceae bacterium]
MTASAMFALILIVFVASTAFSFFLKFLTYSWRNKPIPANVKDVYDAESYKKFQAYSMANLRFSIITGLISTAITLVFLLTEIHARLYSFINPYGDTNYVWAGIFMFLVPVLIGAVIGQLMSIYQTFVIEAKFGFNKTTPVTFVLDFIKMTILLIVIMGGLLSLFLLIYNAIGNWVFLVFIGILFAFQFFMAFISPFLIRIFYKLTPLEDGELKDKVLALAQKTGVTVKGIYVVNASKKSTHMNAFASGFGKTKTIGLFDTLIEKMTHEEVLSVLAHEIGHEKEKHVLKSFPLTILSMFAMAALAFFVIPSDAAGEAFGFAGANIAFGVYLFFILFRPIDRIMDIPSNWLSRKHEYEADQYEVKYVGKEYGVSAMKKLYRDSLGNLTPHPFVVMMEASHPTCTQRVAAMENGAPGKKK